MRRSPMGKIANFAKLIIFAGILWTSFIPQYGYAQGTSPKHIGVLVGNPYLESFFDFLESQGFSPQLLHLSDIQSGVLDSLNVLVLALRSTEGMEEAEKTIIEDWVEAGGTLITVWSTTQFVMNHFNFVAPATLDNGYVYPSKVGWGSGGNTVVMQDPLDSLAFRLPERWLCSGDPIGIFEVFRNLDPSLKVVARLLTDANLDGNNDEVVAYKPIGQGYWVAFFCDFDNFSTNTEYPRVCKFDSTSISQTREEVQLMLNAIHIADQFPIVTVRADIDPDHYPNSIDPLIPQDIYVAMAGNNDEYDIQVMDPYTIQLAGISPKNWYYEDVTNPNQPFELDTTCDTPPVTGPDGTDDLVLVFDSEELVTSLRSTYPSMEDNQCLPVYITGYFTETLAGLRFIGTDSVQLNSEMGNLRGTIRFVLESIDQGNAVVLVSTDADIPAGIDKFKIYLNTDFPFTIETVSSGEGGLISNWSVDTQNTNSYTRPGYILSLGSPAPSYPSLIPNTGGPLFRIRFTNVTLPDHVDQSAFFGKTFNPNYGTIIKYAEVDSTIYAHWQSFNTVLIPFVPYQEPGETVLSGSPENDILPSYPVEITVAPASINPNADYVTDGVEDQQEINAAIEEANALGGGTVRLSNGLYWVNNSINLLSRINLIGAGMDEEDEQKCTTIKLIPNLTTSIKGLIHPKSGNAASNIVIQDLVLDGNEDAEKSYNRIGIYCGYSYFSGHYPEKYLLRRIHVKNFLEYGINFTFYSHQFVITNCRISNNGLDGILIGGQCRDFYIYGNESTGNGRHGFNIYDRSYMGEIVENRASQNGGSGLMIQQYSYLYNIHHNYYSQNSRYGIQVFSGYGLLIEENQCVANQQGGIGCATDPTNLMLKKNQITDSGGSGIYLSHVKNSAVIENQIADSQAHGIRVYRSSYNYLFNNQITNSSLSENDKHTGIHVDDDQSSYSKYNVVIENDISSNDSNRMRYGIRERRNMDDYNLYISNEIEGSVREETDILGPHSQEHESNGIESPTPTPSPTATPTVTPTPTITPTPIP